MKLYHFSVVSHGMHFDVHIEGSSLSEAEAALAATFPEGESDIMVWE